MNKRMKKKYLREEEQTVLKLFRECQYAEFNKHQINHDEAKKFVSILGIPENQKVRFYCGKGKINATGFLKHDLG